MKKLDRDYYLGEAAEAAGLEPDTILEWRRRKLVTNQSYLGGESFLVPNLLAPKEGRRSEDAPFTLVEVLRLAAMRCLVEQHSITILRAAEIVTWTTVEAWKKLAESYLGGEVKSFYLAVQPLGLDSIQVAILPTVEGVMHFLNESGSCAFNVTEQVSHAIHTLIWANA